MSNTSNSNAAPATFALDYHTKQFFDPSEWEGAVEARFFLDMPGMVGREFHCLSDDGRSLEVFGCDYRTLRRTLDGLKLALDTALGPGGDFAGCGRAMWYPWHAEPLEALGVRRAERSWRGSAPPPKLAALMERVFAVTGCQLRLERRDSDCDENRVIDTRVVGLEWANEFRVRSEGVNAHEAMEAAMDLKEMLE